MSHRTTDTELLAELDAKGYRTGGEAGRAAAATPAAPAAARAALRQAARPLWTNFAFATGTLELHLLKYGLAATCARVRAENAAIARPRAVQRPQDVARLAAALAALARYIDTAPDAEETPDPYVPMLNSSGEADRRDS